MALTAQNKAAGMKILLARIAEQQRIAREQSVADNRRKLVCIFRF
jgi:protein subunit release factor A